MADCWLIYSHAKQGGFCKFCAIFAPDSVGGSPLGMFVKQPFTGATNYANGTMLLREHAATHYYQSAVIDASSFMQSYHTSDVANIATTVQQQRLAETKKYLEAVVSAIHFCGLQNISLRGHRDGGALTNPDCFQSEKNEGNFRALLRYRISCGDEMLKSNLQQIPKNATYLSWRVQNELIEIIGNDMREKIINDVRKAVFFSVMVDETSDVSNKEQLSITICYVCESADGKSISIREEFLGFLHAKDLNGEYLSQQILSALSMWGLEPSNMRGQGYDGASNMSGKFQGVQARVSAVYSQAVYMNCACHVLNLALNNACEVSNIYCKPCQPPIT